MTSPVKEPDFLLPNTEQHLLFLSTDADDDDDDFFAACASIEDDQFKR